MLAQVLLFCVLLIACEARDHPRGRLVQNHTNVQPITTRRHKFHPIQSGGQVPFGFGQVLPAPKDLQLEELNRELVPSLQYKKPRVPAFIDRQAMKPDNTTFYPMLPHTPRDLPLRNHVFPTPNPYNTSGLYNKERVQRYPEVRLVSFM